jgi:UDP-N-acetylmuramoylalanine--D-glutamate ligase
MLLAAGFRAMAGGNIGTPVLELLDQDTPDFYVIELSSFQLETTGSLAAAAATVLNISEDHMDRYQSLDQYAGAKRRIYTNTKGPVFNRDDPCSSSWFEQNEKGLSFGLGEPASDREFGVVVEGRRRMLAKGKQLLADVDELVLQGDQNVANVLAAMALVEAAGANLGQPGINAALNYGGLPHRCETVTEHEGVRWINDSKGTNVGATVAAIRGFRGDLILIAGGRGKGADFSQLALAISDHVSHTILFGEDAGEIQHSLAPSSPSTRVDTLAGAVLLARDISSPGSVVLFSPACASFDMFDNFEHRGNVFKGLVLEYIH